MDSITAQNINKPTIRRTKVIRYNSETQTETDARPILLLDVSGSMVRQVNNKRKIDILREVVTTFKGVRLFAFSDYTTEVKFVPEPQNTTDLYSAFKYMKSIITKTTNFILVSDGEPNDPESALNISISLNIPINVVYIGEKEDRGEKFMKQLAEVTGGKEITIDTFSKQFQQQLSEGIIGLLY